MNILKYKELKSKILKYIFRSWKDEPIQPHPLLKIIPPFILELIAYLMAIAIIVNIILLIFN